VLKPRVLIFSKQRACQLEGLLQSLDLHICPAWPVSVLWKSEDRDHSRGYAMVREKWPQVVWQEETDFRKDLTNLLEAMSGEPVMFCTDDGLFFRPIPALSEPDWSQVAGLSLRLGRNSRYCHPANEHYPAPKFLGQGTLLAWQWKKARGDFRVAYSLDAHIYPRRRILELLKRFDFGNPNQLEDRLNRCGVQDAPDWIMCPEQSCYVSLPINRVNSEFPNRAGLQHPASEQELLETYLSGQRLDIRNIVTSSPIGPHQEYPLRWVSSR